MFDMPKLIWSKSLEPHGDAEYLDLLDRLEAKGVPVPLRAWAAAGGADLGELIKGAQDDLEDRKKLEGYRQQIAEMGGGGGDDAGGGGGGGPGEAAFSQDSGYVRSLGGLATGSTRQSLLQNLVKRQYGELAEIRVKGKNGAWKPVRNQAIANRKANQHIAKALGEINKVNVKNAQAAQNEDHRRRNGRRLVSVLGRERQHNPTGTEE